MRVGIIQSNYIPWRGYFDFIDEVDLFIFHDDLQYTKNDWRNRNKIKTKSGTLWLTVPVHYGTTSQLICNTHIDYSNSWHKKHINQLRQWYGRSPYFPDYCKELFDILGRPFNTISDLNIILCSWINEKLNIDTPTDISSKYELRGSKTDRLSDLLKKLGATTYISGPSAKGYLEEKLFRQNGIRLEYKIYDYLPYTQPWGEFIADVTVLDLLFNTGPEARKYLKSMKPNEVIIG